VPIDDIAKVLHHAMPRDHWLFGFNFNVEERDAKGQHSETLAICHTLTLARAGEGGVRRWPYRGHHRCQHYFYFALG